MLDDERDAPRNRKERRAIEAEKRRCSDGQILAFSMAEVRERLGISRTKHMKKSPPVDSARLKAGNRTLITVAAGQAWLDSLPNLAA